MFKYIYVIAIGLRLKPMKEIKTFKTFLAATKCCQHTSIKEIEPRRGKHLKITM